MENIFVFLWIVSQLKHLSESNSEYISYCKTKWYSLVLFPAFSDEHDIISDEQSFVDSVKVKWLPARHNQVGTKNCDLTNYYGLPEK